MQKKVIAYLFSEVRWNLYLTFKIVCKLDWTERSKKMQGESDSFPFSKFNEIYRLHIIPLFNYLKPEIIACEHRLVKDAVFDSSLSNSASNIQATLQEPGGGKPPLQREYVQKEREMQTLQPRVM